MLAKWVAPPTDNVPPIEALPAIVAVPPICASPLIHTSLSNSTLSPKVLLVNVSVVDVPTSVAELVGNVIVKLPL